MRAGLTVVVESPARALTLRCLLPREVAVRATSGHVARLAPGPGGLPHVTPLRGQARVLQELRRLSHGGRLLLATDPDREGEAIAWSIAVALGREREALRLVLPALTAEAVERALANPRRLDPGQLQAHLARRHADAHVAAALARAAGDSLSSGSGLGRVTAAALAILVRQAADGPAPSLAARPGAVEASPFGLTTAALLRGAAAAGITSARAMAILRRLHEGVEIGDEPRCGLVTYPRTDAVAHGPLAACRPELLPHELPLSRDERRIYARVHGREADPVRRRSAPRGETRLLAELEASGVGRPSTIGGVVEALRVRGLAAGVCGALRPTPLGCEVARRIAAAAPRYATPSFSAHLDEELDAIEREAPGVAAAIERVRRRLDGGPVRADPTGFAAGSGWPLP